MRLRIGKLNWSTGSGFAAIFLWSTTIAVARSLSEQVGPLTAATGVYLIGGLLCLIQLWWVRTPLSYFLQLPRRYVLGCGLLFIFYTPTIYLAVGLASDREQVLEVGLINYLWPAATVLLSLPLLKKRANLLLLPGTVLALAGIFLVLTQGANVSWQSFTGHLRSNPAAYSMALGAALSWALYSNLTRRWSEPGSGGAAGLFMAATGLVLLAVRLGWKETTTWNAQAGWEMAVMGAITALAYGLWDVAMRKGNLLLVAACSYLTPLLSSFVSCVYLKVMPGPKLWVGCLLVVLGSFLTWLSVSDPLRSEAEVKPDTK